MVQDLTLAKTYAPLMAASAAAELIDRPDLRIDQAGDITVSYAPFDHIERRARLVVVGITPGRTQMVNALNAAHHALAAGRTLETALAEAKLTASFSGGVIRNNLVAMLDEIGVAGRLGVASTAELFQPGSRDIHFTSALRYPVFVKGENYSGNPDMLRIPMLRNMVETHLAEEAAALPHAIWLPLGPKAEAALCHLARIGKIDETRILAGLPHPSGANAERIAIFLGRKSPGEASRASRPAPLLAARERLCQKIEQMSEVSA